MPRTAKTICVKHHKFFRAQIAADPFNDPWNLLQGDFSRWLIVEDDENCFPSPSNSIVTVNGYIIRESPQTFRIVADPDRTFDVKFLMNC